LLAHFAFLRAGDLPFDLIVVENDSVEVVYDLAEGMERITKMELN